MKFIELSLFSAYLIEPKKHEDERGFFSRVFCEESFREKGLCSKFPQSNISYNKRKGTLRGMHYQKAPFEEVKLVFCASGSIYDCIVDLRVDSPTYLRWTSVELSANNRQLLYVPKGFAHGFLTLEDETEVVYQVSSPYTPASEQGIRYDDPTFGIRWPFSPAVISKKDQTHPLRENQ